MTNTSGIGTKRTKTIIIFLVILAICGMAGFLTGMILYKVNSPSFTWDIVTITNIAKVYAAIIWIVNAALFLVCVFMYAGLKKQWNSCSDDDCDKLDRIEYERYKPMLISIIAFVINLLMLAGDFWLLSFSKTMDLHEAKTYFFAIMPAFFFGIIWVTVLQDRIIQLNKRMNPEKRGDILDFRFQKKWLDSCDEAQRSDIYHAGYNAFKTTSFACMICWLIALISIYWLDTGLTPVILVCAIQLASQLSYFVTLMKLKKPARSNKQ